MFIKFLEQRNLKNVAPFNQTTHEVIFYAINEENKKINNAKYFLLHVTFSFP